MHLGLKNWPIVPHNLIPVQGSPVPLLKFQMTLIVEDSVNPANLFRRTTLHILKRMRHVIAGGCVASPT
jgi:hypothetical protein